MATEENAGPHKGLGFTLCMHSDIFVLTKPMFYFHHYSIMSIVSICNLEAFSVQPKKIRVQILHTRKIFFAGLKSFQIVDWNHTHNENKTWVLKVQKYLNAYPKSVPKNITMVRHTKIKVCTWL